MKWPKWTKEIHEGRPRLSNPLLELMNCNPYQIFKKKHLLLCRLPHNKMFCPVLSSPLLTSPRQQVLSYILHIFAKSVFAERLTVSFSERKCISQICFLLRAANCCSDLPVLHVSSVFQISSKQRLTTNTKNTIVIFCPVVLYNTKRTHSWQYKGFSLWWKSSICLLVE